MAALTQSFFQVRLSGAITSTTGSNRISVGGIPGLNILDSGNFANIVQLNSLSGFSTGLSGYLQNEINNIYAGENLLFTTGNQSKTGNFSVLGSFSFSSGINTPVQYFGTSNYTLVSGNYMVIATGNPANITGIVPNALAYSGNLFTLINNCSGPLQISGVIGPDTNPLISQYDCLEIYGTSGIWNYIRQTGNAGLVAAITSLSGWAASAANLFITGASGIAYTNLISGMLALQIAGASAGVSAMNGLSGMLTLVGTGNGAGSQITNIIVSTGAGGHIYISGSGIAQAVDLANSGSNLYTMLVNASGLFATAINLAATGSTLYQLITAFSGTFQDFQVIALTGISGGQTVTYPSAFPVAPGVVLANMEIWSGNSYGYGVWVQNITATNFLAAFSDNLLETGNLLLIYAHL